ncbi:hypothetical protein I79_016021 [Cricetulus griseus]|uniref:Uncharacterized protein n=1 Tax=Cricetulus griseus TaxID=10029 RepID=G3HY98_CRIGR|nr:hypothetical protein I79_016021 [Cricetulus griseus]
MLLLYTKRPPLPQGHDVAPAGMEVTLYTRLASNSQRSSCLFLLSAGIRGVHHLTSPHPF